MIFRRGPDMSSVHKGNQDSVLAVDTVADIQALPRATDTILVRRLDDDKARALSHLPQLRVLYQDGSPSQLTDVGLQALARLRTLEKLDLEWASGITDRGLTVLHQLRDLRWLDLGGCSGLSEGAVQELRRAFPNADVER
jgi:hypothetical protein